MENYAIWAAIGLAFCSLEMLSGTFDLLILGLAALLIALLTYTCPEISFSIQFMLYAFLSFLTLIAWHQKAKREPVLSRVGQSIGEEIGAVGTISEEVTRDKLGKIIFSRAVLGDKEWTVYSMDSIQVGEKAEVVEVDGNILKVKKTI